MHSLRSVQHMPVIEEHHNDYSSISDTDMRAAASLSLSSPSPPPPALPKKSPRRTSYVYAMRLKEQSSSYPFHPPPAYSPHTSPGMDIDAEKVKLGEAPPPRKFRKPDFVTRRGGWWRLALIVVAVVACLLALALGLGLGLRHGR